MNLIIINYIYKLMSTAFQVYKLDNNTRLYYEEDKVNLLNIFNLLSDYLIKSLSIKSYDYLMRIIDALFSSCFYNIHLRLIKNDDVFNIWEKIFNYANALFNTNSAGNYNNKKEIYIKYLYIVYSVIKNIHLENCELLYELYIKKNTNNNNFTFFKEIEKNIITIIEEFSQKSHNFDSFIINSAILLYNIIIISLKKNTSNYYYDCSNIIKYIRNLNPSNINEIDLTISLYKNIITSCEKNSIYIEIIENCLVPLDITNSKFEIINNDDDRIILSKKLCEYILLILPELSYRFNVIADKNNKFNSIFCSLFEKLINAYEKSDDEQLDCLYCKLVQLLCQNNYLLKEFIKDYIIRLTSSMIFHLHHFKSSLNNNNIFYYFIIFKYFITCSKDKFLEALHNIFHDDAIILVVGCYLESINYLDYKDLDIEIQNLNLSFILDLGELLLVTDVKKDQFISKYFSFADNIKNKNSNRNVH